MKYENSLFEVISLPSLLNKYDLNEEMDAILLLCADDYQGIISFDDIMKPKDMLYHCTKSQDKNLLIFISSNFS